MFMLLNKDGTKFNNAVLKIEKVNNKKNNHLRKLKKTSIYVKVKNITDGKFIYINSTEGSTNKKTTTPTTCSGKSSRRITRTFTSKKNEENIFPKKNNRPIDSKNIIISINIKFLSSNLFLYACFSNNLTIFLNNIPICKLMIHLLLYY